MKSIYKYPLTTTGLQSVSMPLGAEILSLQTQNECPCIWALVNPNLPREDRDFFIYGTGHKVPMDITKETFIGTYQLQGGSLVFHVFELKR